MLQTLRTSEPDMSTLDSREDVGSNLLSVALIGPDENRRYTVANAMSGLPCRITQQLAAYPDLDQLPRLIKLSFDIVILDLDSHPEYALELIENLCAVSQTTVMVYSAR